MDPIATALHALNNGLHVAQYLLAELPAGTQALTIGKDELQALRDKMQEAKEALVKFTQSSNTLSR